MNPKATTPQDAATGLRIKALREAGRLSRSVLGRAIGVSYQQIEKYENGTNRVGASRLQGMALALHVPISALFGEAEGTDQSDVLALLVEPGAMDLLEAYAAIEDEELRHDVLARVKAAASIGRASG